MEREGNEASILNYDFILFRCIFIYILFRNRKKGDSKELERESVEFTHFALTKLIYYHFALEYYLFYNVLIKYCNIIK